MPTPCTSRKGDDEIAFYRSYTTSTHCLFSCRITAPPACPAVRMRCPLLPPFAAPYFPAVALPALYRPSTLCRICHCFLLLVGAFLLVHAMLSRSRIVMSCWVCALSNLLYLSSQPESEMSQFLVGARENVPQELYKVPLSMKETIARVIHSPSMPVDVGNRWFVDGSLLLMFHGSAL